MKFEEIAQHSLSQLFEELGIIKAVPADDAISSSNPITWSEPMTGDQLEERMRQVIGIAGNE